MHIISDVKWLAMLSITLLVVKSKREIKCKDRCISFKHLSRVTFVSLVLLLQDEFSTVIPSKLPRNFYVTNFLNYLYTIIFIDLEVSFEKKYQEAPSRSYTFQVKDKFVRFLVKTKK